MVVVGAAAMAFIPDEPSIRVPAIIGMGTLILTGMLGFVAQFTQASDDRDEFQSKITERIKETPKDETIVIIKDRSIPAHILNRLIREIDAMPVRYD